VPVRIERLIVAPVVTAQNRVNRDKRSIVHGASAVVAKDHWESDSLWVGCDPAQRKNVVSIQARVRYLDSQPTLGHLRFREIADGESGQRIVRIRFEGVNGKHCQTFSLITLR
jgi:hypothetical protein